jgi:hypothetical protein
MAESQIDLDKTLTANQLFKIYKEDGGTLNFSEWLTREKTKGIFPLNDGLNQEINLTLNKFKTKEKDMGKTVLGMPVKTLYIVGGIILLAVVARQIMKKK